MTNAQAVELFVLASSAVGFYFSAAMAWTETGRLTPFYSILSAVFAVEASLMGFALLLGII